MTEEQIALAKRAVACKGWRWMEGMAVVDGDGYTNRVTRVEPCDVYGDGAEVVPFEMVHRLVGDGWCGQWREYGILPDLIDPATLGCLLSLVREAHGHELLHLSYRIAKGDVGFACYTPRPRPWVSSEAEALVAALEDAP